MVNKADVNQKELDKLDELYIRAYETRSIGILKAYSKPEFLYKLARLFMLRPKYFSDEIYRKNTWELLETNGAELTYLKTCRYESVRLGAIRKVKIANDYSEKWVVMQSNGRLIICDIGEETPL